MQFSIIAGLAILAATANAQNCASAQQQKRLTGLTNHVTHPAQFCQFWLRGR